jgi:hypothetical protein
MRVAASGRAADPTMTEHSLWVFVHVLLLVYWLGADLGVLLLARAAKRPDLSFAERAFALKMAVTIDLTPRLCFALMLPVGLHVTDSGGFAEVPAALLLVAWIVALGWIALLFAIGRNEGKPAAAALGRANLALQAVLLLAVGAVAVASLLGAGPLQPGWFPVKLLAFAAIFACSIGIDFAFHPIVPAFLRLATEGSKPEIEHTIGVAVDGAIRWVLALYALLVLIAFLGIVKPF